LKSNFAEKGIGKNHFPNQLKIGKPFLQIPSISQMPLYEGINVKVLNLWIKVLK